MHRSHSYHMQLLKFSIDILLYIKKMLVKNMFMRIYFIIVMLVMILYNIINIYLLYIIIKLFEVYYFYYFKLTKYDNISYVIFYKHH